MSYASAAIGTVEMNIGLRRGSNFYSITNIKELLSSLPTKGSSTPRQAAHGEDGGTRHYAPRTLSFEGEIHATSVSQRVAMERALRVAVGIPRVPSDSGDDGYKRIDITDEFGNGLFIHAIVVEMPEFSLLYEGRETMSRFRFTMIADEDPFFYGQDVSSLVGDESFESTTFTLQDGDLMALQDGSLPALQDLLAGLTVDNEGTEGSPPVITIYGPSESPVVSNATTGKSMDLDGLSLASGERVEVDVAHTTITKFDTLDAETDVSAYLTVESEWIFVEPGENAFSLIDDSTDDLSAQLGVVFRSCYA